MPRGRAHIEAAFARYRKNRGAERQMGRLRRAADDLLQGLVPLQLAFVVDGGRRIAASCGRQCGKSLSISRRLLRRALAKPKALCIYANATHHEARRVMWDDPEDGLPAVVRRTGLREGEDFRLNNSDLRVTFSNGSSVVATGLDRGGWEKLRGSRIDELCVDESQKANGLAEAVPSVISPALAAKPGTLTIAGTPNEFCAGLLHDAAEGIALGWSVHRWTAADIVDARPDIAPQLAADYDAMGIPPDDPVRLREERGLWVRGGAGRIFPVLKHHAGLPSTAHGRPFDYRWRYVCGVDPGYSPDPFAWCVLASSRYHPAVFEVESGALEEQTTDMQLAVLRDVAARHPVSAFVVDAGNKQIAQDYAARSTLPFAHAEKFGKAVQLEEMSSDCRAGRLLVLEGSRLHAELPQLRWDERAYARGKKDLDPRQPNDAADACQYALRWMRHHWHEEPAEPETDEMRLEREVREFRESVMSRRGAQPQGRRRSTYGPPRDRRDT